MSLLGIDVGTTATKVVAFDQTGQILASASREYPLAAPEPGLLELDPDRVWTAVAECIRVVNSQVRADPVTALAVSAQGEAIIPVDNDGKVLAPSPVTFDTRAVEQMTRLEARLGRDTLFATTGQPPHPMYSLAKILWWRERRPELFAAAWKFLCYGDFVSFRLGAEPAIDRSMAARTLAFDINENGWSSTILAASGLAESQLPRVVPSGTAIGRVARSVAGDLGFSSPPTIVAGGHDQPCGAFGAGTAPDGEAMFALGTTVCLAPVFPAPLAGLRERDYPCYPHVVPNRFISLGGNFTGGSLLRWFRDRFGDAEVAEAAATGRDVYDLLLDHAAPNPSQLLTLPHFAGSGAPFNDPLSKGAIVGLSFGTDRADIIRSLLEGVMMEMALVRDGLAEAGVEIARLVAIGGGARSDRWLQIAADILERPLRRSTQNEAACWGAARLAGIATGLCDWNDSAAGSASAHESVTFFPRPALAEYYRERLAIYRSLYVSLREISHRL